MLRACSTKTIVFRTVAGSQCAMVGSCFNNSIRRLKSERYIHASSKVDIDPASEAILGMIFVDQHLSIGSLYAKGNQLELLKFEYTARLNNNIRQSRIA